MNIDFEKACVAMERQSALAKDENSTKTIAEFLYDKCHYFTVIISECLRAEITLPRGLYNPNIFKK